MAKNALDDYSTTAASNTDFDGTDSTGATGKVKDGDGYARSIAAHAKAKHLDLGAANTVAGTGDAITVTLASNTTALYDGMRLSINAPGTNTGATTIAVTNSGAGSLGTKKIRKWSAGVETALSAGDITSAHILNLVYDSARDSAAGAFMIDSAATASDTVAGTIEIAIQSEMETGSSTTLAVTPGRQHFHPSSAKCWVKCDAAAAIQASYNVTSVTDDGTGLVTVTIATDFSSNNYAITPAAFDNTTADQMRATSISALAAGTFQGKCVNHTPTKIDPINWYFAAFGDQA